ncbi:MAG: FIST C-terminal domain-containing protein [Oscillospiraceae bacterium]|nr:FIST C-terminal domain-containing protein [Oscillospiraceae bacterium]
MKQIIGRSLEGDVREAVRGLEPAPSMLLMYSDKEHFEENVLTLEKLYPGVPSISGPGIFYGYGHSPRGVGVCALYGVEAVTGVMHNVSTAPVTDIGSLKRNCMSIGAGNENTVCLTLCTGNDACALTTLYSVLSHHGIHVSGGAVEAGQSVAYNGIICPDSLVYAIVKNPMGKAKVYKENIYRPMGEERYIASHTDPSTYYIGELNGKPAKLLYEELLHITDDQVTDSTLVNPFGRIVGNDIYIVSVSGTLGDGLTCYREVNDSDVLVLLELKDIKSTVRHTIDRIHSDLSRVSGMISVNCFFRYNLFEMEGYLEDYLREMAIAPHCGFFGYGEHYNGQFINQSMSCAVFE